jgi:hypothetical protein
MAVITPPKGWLGGVVKKAAKPPKPKVAIPELDIPDDFYGQLIPKWAGADGDLFAAPTAGNELIDFEGLINSDPRAITSKAQMEENIAAAALAREAAIKRAMLALSGQEKDIARGAGFQQADLGANLAGRGMLNSGGYGAGTMRVEENRSRAVAEATQRAQDIEAQAYSTEADIARQARQGWESTLGDVAADLADDPRYQTEEQKKKEDNEANKGKTTTTKKKPPPKRVTQKKNVPGSRGFRPM